MMKTIAAIPRKYEDAVTTLARWHADAQSEYRDLEIFSIPDPEKSIVRLLEISDSFPVTGDAFPVTFGASKEFPFKSSVLIATQSEWNKIQKGKLKLPDEWNLNSKVKVHPHG